MISLSTLNALPAAEFTAVLAAIFEHSPWVPERATQQRPFDSAIALHRTLCETVSRADGELQLDLIRAHPELAGRAAIRGDLTAASMSEQQGAGLGACTPLQYERLQALNAAYRSRFGFPFILAVKGHTPDSVIAALAERVTHAPAVEREVALQQIFKIARFRLTDLIEEPLGDAIMAMAEDLASFTETPGMLTCSYLTPTHRATADRVRDYMLAAGLHAHVDAVGNVVGVLAGAGSTPRRLLTGSHYDTVINAGKYDGRLGILLPIAVAGALRRSGTQLPFSLEIIAFSEEEGVRFKSTFLGSRAVAGRFDSGVLEACDAEGITLRGALEVAGLDPVAIPAIARSSAEVSGFIEVHIEQGPVLLQNGLAVGVVTAIAGSVRSIVTVEGLSGHAGTVPMPLRRDAAAAAAEMVLAIEQRCSEVGVVGTVGQLHVPNGAVNVIPGRCEFSIDIRSGDDALRDAADADVREALEQIAARRQVAITLRRVVTAASVPCRKSLQDAWAASIERITAGTAHRLPSGAGHDAMMMSELTDVGMLFVRCGNGGISHHPDESLSTADADIAARVFQDFLMHFEAA